MNWFSTIGPPFVVVIFTYLLAGVMSDGNLFKPIYAIVWKIKKIGRGR